MDRPYRFLILEDLPSDAILLKRVLKKNFDPCEFHVLDNQVEYLKILGEFIPDVVISDYCIPGFDWHKAQTLANERSLNLPFIIVTGTLNSKVREECLQTGATDYLSKDHVEEVVPVLKRIFEQQGLK
jgi:CheY-like chemotaxis protein